MQKSTDDARQQLNRRGFLHLAAGGAAGIAGMLAGRQPAAVAQSQELTVLSFNRFVPQSKAVTGTPIREAIAWGEGEVRKVLQGKAG